MIDLQGRITVAAFAVPLDGVELVTPNVSRRLHWAEKARRAKALRALAFMSVPSYARGAQAASKRYIVLRLVRGKGQRMVDPDAIPMALKHLLDGLVDAGLLVDDSGQWCEPAYFQAREERPRVDVVVSE